MGSREKREFNKKKQEKKEKQKRIILRTEFISSNKMITIIICFRILVFPFYFSVFLLVFQFPPPAQRPFPSILPHPTVLSLTNTCHTMMTRLQYIYPHDPLQLPLEKDKDPKLHEQASNINQHRQTKTTPWNHLNSLSPDQSILTKT